MDFYNDTSFIPLGMAMAMMDDALDYDKIRNMTEAQREDLLYRAKDQGDMEKIQMILSDEKS